MKIFEHENIYYESLITRKFQDLRYMTYESLLVYIQYSPRIHWNPSHW